METEYINGTKITFFWNEAPCGSWLVSRKTLLFLSSTMKIEKKSLSKHWYSPTKLNGVRFHETVTSIRNIYLSQTFNLKKVKLFNDANSVMT
jgi:hypothetical protein